MPYLNHPPLAALIASLPVAESSVEVRAGLWQRPCLQAGRKDLHDAFFAGHERVRISREWLLRDSAPGPAELRVFGVLLWGYPLGVRTGHPGRWLERLPAITSAATLTGEWEPYFAQVGEAGGMGIGTVSMLAHFLGHSFGEHRALILDRSIIAACAAARWPELRTLRDLTPGQAPRHYPDYLRVMHGIAGAGNFSPEQLEFFLHTLADSF